MLVPSVVSAAIGVEDHLLAETGEQAWLVSQTCMRRDWLCVVAGLPCLYRTFRITMGESSKFPKS